MFLYHGSTVEIKEIDLTLSKPNKDFGRGFYLSDNFEQAYEMATYKAGLFGTEPYVTKFEFDENLLKNGSLKILSFSEYSKEWADFVFKNRHQENQDFSHDYDIVTGPIANDRVGAQIRRFVEGDISFDTFLERLKYMKGITFQYFFGTQKAIQTLAKQRTSAMNDIEYQIECTTRDLATYLVRDFSFTVEQALRAVYNSELYQKLCDPKTGLYFQSPLYVYDYLKTEIKTGKLQ